MKYYDCLVLLFLTSGLFISCPGQKTSEPSSKMADIKLSQYESTIVQFEMEDQRSRYASDLIVFTGSSSIVLWSSLADDMKGLPTLNRGFGGSTNPEVYHFAERIIYKHQPKLVVYYCGENDIFLGASAKDAFESFKKFANEYNQKLPNSKLVFISIKPSPSRWHLWPEFQKANSLIKEFIDGVDDFYYFDASVSMLNDQGQPNQNIFLEDGLHMNSLGYQAWTKELYPLIDRIYNP